MKILQISPQLPFPPDDGGRIGIYNITKYLALRGNDIDLISYSRNQITAEARKNLSAFCKLTVVPVNASNSLLGMVLNLVSDIPYNISKYRTRAMEDALHAYLRVESPDVVHVDHLHMAWVLDVVRQYTKAPVVLREHNVEMTIMQRFAQNNKNPLVKFYAELQVEKFVRYEPLMCSLFNGCVPITEIDEQRLDAFNLPINSRVISAGVSADLIKMSPSNEVVPFSLYHIGSLEWTPNIQAVVWFLTEVYPAIVEKFPEVCFFLYGRGAEKIVIPQNIRDHVVVKGFVENLWDEISNKQVAIVPLLTGGGMRIKILELMAAGKTIITTDVGKEGIPFINNEHGIVANTPAEIAAGVERVFNNPEISNSFAKASKALIKERFSWEAIAEQFEMFYRDLINANVQ